MIRGVILVGVGRNMNRVIRTCYSFGVHDIYCMACTGRVSGNLFSATGQVRLHTIDSLDNFRRDSILGLEAIRGLPLLQDYPMHDIKYLAVGGESVSLRQCDFPRMARIPTANSLCLTVEAALAISLYHTGGGGYD